MSHREVRGARGSLSLDGETGSREKRLQYLDGATTAWGVGTPQSQSAAGCLKAFPEILANAKKKVKNILITL